MIKILASWQHYIFPSLLASSFSFDTTTFIMDINISFQLATADAAGDEHLCPHLNQNRVITHPLELEATDGHRYEFWYQPRTMRFKCYDEDDKTYFDAYCLPVTNTTYTCEGTVYTIRKHPGPKVLAASTHRYSKLNLLTLCVASNDRKQRTYGGGRPAADRRGRRFGRRNRQGARLRGRETGMGPPA